MKRDGVDRINIFSDVTTIKKDQIILKGGKNDEAGFALLPANDDEEKKGEIALWRAVITQALMDAGSRSNKREMRYDRAQAVSWLSGISQDFHMVCSLAGFDSGYVVQKAKEAIKRGCVWRKKI